MVVHPDDGSHGPVVLVGCGLHGFTTLSNKSDSVVEVQHPRGGQRCVLTQAVAGMAAGFDTQPAYSVEGHHRGHKGGELRISCFAQFLVA